MNVAVKPLLVVQIILSFVADNMDKENTMLVQMYFSSL